MELADFDEKSILKEVDQILHVKEGPPVTAPISGNTDIKSAGAIMGKGNFFGPAELGLVHEELHEWGFNVKMNMRGNNFDYVPHSPEVLEKARDLGFRLFLRTHTIQIDELVYYLTMKRLLEFTRGRNIITPGQGSNKWGVHFSQPTGRQISREVSTEWAFVASDLLTGSTNTNRTGQQRLLGEYGSLLRGQGLPVVVRGRSATQALFDHIVYLITTGEPLLTGQADLTRSSLLVREGHELYIKVGGPRYPSDGPIVITQFDPQNSSPKVGVIPTF